MQKFDGVDFLEIDGLFSDEEILVRDSVRRFVQDRVLPVIEKHNREGTFPAADKWMSQVTDKDLTDNPDLLYGANYTQGMAIELGHFSRYSGGKAGW